MMRQLRTLLWKEWRDHRAALIAIAIALPVLLGLALWGFGDRLIQDNRRPEPTVMLLPFVALLVVIAVGSELVAGEARRETLGFLLRIPSGLLKPLLAKLLFYVLAMAGMIAWALMLLFAVHGLYDHLGVFGEAFRQNGAYWQDWTGLVAFGGIWVILVSCWVPRGSGAVLGGVLLLGLVVLPLVLFVQAEPRYFLPTRAGGLQSTDAFERTIRFYAFSFGGWAALTAVAAIVLSFVVGRRFGRGVWSSAWRGLSVVGLFMLVTTVWGAQRLHDLHTLTPEDPTFRIGSVQVLRGERWALAMVGKHAAPQQVWAIDLISGTHRPIPPPDASLLWNTRGGWLGNGANHLRSVSMKPSRIGVVTFIEGFGESRIFVYRWFDGFTGTVSKTLPSSIPYPEIDGLHDEELREWTTVRASDGRRAWLCRRPGKDHRGAVGYAVEQPDGSVKRHVVGAGVQPIVETDWGWLASTGWRAKEIFIIAPFEHHPVRVVRPRRPDGKRFYGWTLLHSVVTAPAPDRILLRFGNRIYWMDRKGNLTEHTIEGLTNFGQSFRQIDDKRRVRALRDGKKVYLHFDVDTGEYEERAERRPQLFRSLGDGRYLALDGKGVVMLAESVHGPLTDLPNADGLLLVGQAHDCSVLAVQDGKRIVRYHYRTGKIERIWPKNGGVRE